MNPLEQVVRTQAALQKSGPELQRLRKACDGMEANFYKTLIATMRKASPEVKTGDSMGGDFYIDMFDDTVANSMAEQGSLGISRMLYTAMATRVVGQAMHSQHLEAGKTAEEPTR